MNVSFQTVNGTAMGTGACPAPATATQDFRTSAGTVTVGPNSTVNIPVITCANATGEVTETFSVILTGTTGGTITVSQGVGTIAA